MYQLRQYQIDLIDKIYESWAQGNRRVMAQLATGGGKTIVLSSIVKEISNSGLKVLVLAHRQELINQLVEKLEAIVNEPVGVIMAGVKPNYDRDIQVGSVQSMARRLESCPHLDLIVIDESHHSSSASYVKITDKYPEAKVLGVTATPIRLDGKGFRGVFDDLICGVSTQDLIGMGSLSQYKQYACEKPMSVLGLKKRGGDFKAEEIEQQNPIEVVANQVYESYNRHLIGKQAVIFATSVAHSLAITEHLRSTGIAAHHLDGMSPTDERRSAMELFRSREIQILSNCSLFDEGLDIPSIDGVILARPTASLSRYLQMCLDLETEILTIDGFKKFNEINGQKVAAFNLDNNEIVWVDIREYIYRKVGEDEKMFGIQNPSVDIRVTGGHNMVAKGLRVKDWSIETAFELASRKTGYTIPIAGFSSNKGLDLKDDELRFLGWFLTDGTRNKTNGQVTISQSANQKWLKRIPDCLNACGFRVGIHTREVETNYGKYIRHSYSISKGNPTKLIDKHLTGYSRLDEFVDKTMGSAYDHISREQLLILLQEMNYGNGAKPQNIDWVQQSYHISTDYKLQAEKIQFLCITRGLKCNITTSYQNGDVPLYVMHIKDTAVKTLKGTNCNDNSVLKECSIDKNEYVWCLRNDYRTLITRRNGKVSVMGNCGRSLRPCEGKERAVIIDLADNYERHGMPDDDRDWTLDGIPKKPKEQKTSKRERNVITDEIETIALFDTGTEYIEIAGKTVVLTEDLREWMRLADAIIAEGVEREFKPGWAAHRLLASDIQPPLEAWKYLGKKLGYHHVWAKYKYDEWAAK